MVPFSKFSKDKVQFSNKTLSSLLIILTCAKRTKQSVSGSPIIIRSASHELPELFTMTSPSVTLFCSGSLQ